MSPHVYLSQEVYDSYSSRSETKAVEQRRDRKRERARSGVGAGVSAASGGAGEGAVEAQTAAGPARPSQREWRRLSKGQRARGRGRARIPAI